LGDYLGDDGLGNEGFATTDRVELECWMVRELLTEKGVR
jgi:hypothetical protein